MNKGLKIGIALIVIALLALILPMALSPGKNDQVLIEEALAESIKAGREGRPGSVLDLLSQSFEINGQEVANRNQIARAIRDYKPDVTLERTLAEVQGDTASITSPLKLKLQPPLNAEYNVPNVVLEFQRENTTKLLIFPDKKWKLTKVTVPPESWAQMMFGL